MTYKELEFPQAAIVKSVDGSLFVYGSREFGVPETGGVCALQADGTCTGGLSLLFIGPVHNLTFKGYFGATSDVATITAYSGDAAISLQLVSGNDDGQIDVDFSGVSGITRLEIASATSGASNGIAYGDFDFVVDPPDTEPPPPLPGKRLSFDALKSGVNGPVVDIGMARITETSGGDLFVYRSGDFFVPKNGAICAVLADFTCMGDLLLEFDVPIFDLMFSGFFAKTTDSMIVSLFNDDQLVFSDQFWGNSGGTILFDFRDKGVLTRIKIEDLSEKLTKGIAYGDFRYEIYEAVPSPVPLPASMLLLIFAVLMLGLPNLRRLLRNPVA